jgi:hypothetical protein
MGLDELWSDEQITRDLQLLETMQMADDIRAIRQSRSRPMLASIVSQPRSRSVRRKTDWTFWQGLKFGFLLWFFLVAVIVAVAYVQQWLGTF